MNEKIEYYAFLLGQIEQRVGDPERAIAILQQIGKDNRMQQIQSEMTKGVSKSQPASEKQLNYMKDLGVEMKPGLTSKEASALIEKAKKNRSQ